MSDELYVSDYLTNTSMVCIYGVFIYDNNCPLQPYRDVLQLESLSQLNSSHALMQQTSCVLERICLFKEVRYCSLPHCGTISNEHIIYKKQQKLVAKCNTEVYKEDYQ